jgi:ferredoxin
MIRDFIVWSQQFPSQIEKVLCKGCGTPIRALMPTDKFSTTERIGDQTIVRERLLLATLSSYVEVEMEMADGSSHITGACATCAATVTDRELKEWYAADLDMMDNENKRANVDGDRYMTKLRERVVTQIAPVVSDAEKRAQTKPDTRS